MCVCVCAAGRQLAGPFFFFSPLPPALPARLGEPLSNCDWCAPIAVCAGAAALGPGEAAVYLWLEKRLGQGPPLVKHLNPHKQLWVWFSPQKSSRPVVCPSVCLLWPELSCLCPLVPYVLDRPKFWSGRQVALPGHLAGFKVLECWLDKYLVHCQINPRVQYSLLLATLLAGKLAQMLKSTILKWFPGYFNNQETHWEYKKHSWGFSGLNEFKKYIKRLKGHDLEK